MRSTILYLEPLAPAKPPEGAPCNGCGLCCLAAPCPLGMVLSRRRTGACAALHWNAEQGRYRCGALVSPQAVLAHALPARWRGLAGWLARPLRLLAWRWIAAGHGCDSSLEPQPPQGGPAAR